MIRPLDPSVRAQLRSGVSVPSVAQCVEELVLNSLDAAATCIAVRIDLENFWIQVVDNGHGIPKDQLTIVGDRYATSKCHTVTDLENLNFFGFRGEALASIAQVCAVLEIESRHKVSTKVNTKVFRHGKVVSVFESKNHRPTNGTTVTVHNVFHNLPVRQKFVSASLEWERIRERVAAIALIHPGVSFTLRNENVGGKYLQTHKTSSLVACFGSLFGNKKSMSLREASHQHKQFKISGFISREGHRNKDLQFLYINSRLILRTKVHKFLNLLLSKSTVVNRRAGQWEPRTPTVRDSSAADASSPGKQRDYYGMFVLNISCPLSEYDISLDPSKTLVEFKEWETLLTCVQDMVQKFLKQENLTMSLDPNVGEHMSSLLQDEKITISKSSPGRAGTAGVDLQTVTNNSGVDYGEGISTLNSNAILHSKTVNRLSHTKLANSGDTEGQGHADNARSEPEDGTCKASAEESHHLCTSVYMDDICQEDKYQMPREDKAVPVHIDLESHASHTSAKAESKGAELTSEEQSGMDDTMDDTFDYGPAVSQGYSNEQLFTTNSLNDSFLKENDIQSLVVSSDVESSTVTSAPVPDLSSHQCQTLADSNESKLGHADDRLEEENVHCNSNEVSNSPPKQLFTSIKVTRSPPDFKETRTVSSELNDSGVELYDDGRATEKSCLTKFSKASKSSKITLSGKKQPSLSSKLSKMANISTDDGEKHVVRPSSIDVRNNTLPEDLPQVDARPQQKHHVRLEDKAKDSTNEYTRIGKNDESCGLIALDRVKSTSSLGLFKTSQAELVRTELYPRDSGKSFRRSTSKGKCKDASPVSMMKDESLCHSSSSAVTSTPRRACLGTASPSMCLNKSSCKFTPAISLKRSYSELSLQKLSKRVRLYSGDATLQKHFSARHQSKEQNLSSDIQRDVTKKEGKTEQKPKQSIFKTPHGKNVTIDNVNDPRVHKQITTESAVNNESSEKRTRNLTNNYIHISGDKCSVPYRVDNQAKMKRKFVTSENLLQTPSKILLQKAHQSDAAKAQEGSKAGSALLLFAGQTEQRKVQCPTSRTESAHISPMEWQGINEVTYESHGWRHEVPNQVEDTDSSMLYYPDISVDVKEKLKTATKDLAYETSDLIHAASEQGMENSLARTVSSHDKDLALQSRSPSSDETDKFVFSPKSTFKNVSMAAIIPSKTFQEDAEDTRELLCASSNFHEIDSQPINPARFLGEMRELCRFSSTSEETVRNECHTRSNFQKYEHESTVHQGSTESLHSVCNQQEVNRDCGEMELDSTGLCAAEKVRNCELIGKLKDTHGNNSANWEQGLEQIVPGSHESIDLTCQPAEHGSEDVPNEYTGNSLHNRELCEDSQCAQISRTPKPVIPTRAVTSRQLSTSSPNVITATSPAGCHSKADMVRHDSMEDCRSDGLENMADMKAKTGAVEKDCTVQEKERSCEMSVGSGQKVVESHEAQEELCKIKVTDRELTNTTKQCSLEHRRSALSDGFRKVNAVWARQFDQTCGVEVYVNLMTGHTQLDCPEDDRVDVGTSSSVNVSMSAGGEKKWKGTVHPFLTHNATPFLPRAKRPCHDTDKLSTSSTQHALGQMLAAHQEEQEEEEGSGVKWRDRVPNEADESDNEESVAQLWDSWENPVFSRTEKSILNVAAGTGGTARVRTVIQPYRFSREMLDSIQIIGQVDNKFIACMMKNSSHNFTTTSAPNLLVLIDQHAAHERVRLEKLHEDLYEVDPGSPYQHLKSSHVIPPLEVPLPAEELRLLQAYKPAFQRLGLNFSTDDNKMNTAVVSSLPCCVVEREYNERKRGRLAVAVELVESLIKEKLELLKTTDGAGATLPHTLHRILNSQACHGAIKFGDPLEEADCADLIRCLSRCNLPFQCAHGRPSLIPIIDLTSPIQKEEQSQEYSRPNLGKLKHRIACEGSQSSHHKALQEDHSLLQES